MRLVAALVTSLALVAPKPAKAHEGCHSRKCRAKVAHKACDQRHPRQCVLHVIYHKRLTGWKRAWLLRIPACESTWNPYATNGPHAGLFQFRVAPPSTWATTPYARRSPYSARWQAFAAAWMLKVGRAGEWSCK